MAINVNQERITPETPSILKGERIYVYVPKATNDTAGIASYSDDYFYLDINNKVHLKSTDPFKKESLVKLSDIDFVKNNQGAIDINWVYAHNPGESNNTHGYGLMKIDTNSVGYLRFNEGLLEVDYGKLMNQLEEDMTFTDLENRISNVELVNAQQSTQINQNTTNITTLQTIKANISDLAIYELKSNRVSTLINPSDNTYPSTNLLNTVKTELEQLISTLVDNLDSEIDNRRDVDIGLQTSINASAHRLEFSVNTTTYVLTATLKDGNGNILGTPQTVDLPIEGLVLNVTFDDTTDELVITLQNGNVTRVSLGSIISGLQAQLDATQLQAVNSGITSSLVSQISTNQTAITNLNNLKMNITNPTGSGSLSINRRSNTTVGDYSIATGYYPTSSGFASFTTGIHNSATAEAAFAEGENTEASGLAAHASGNSTSASGNYSYVLGNGTIAQRVSQFVFGEYNIADSTGTTTTKGDYIEIVGNGTGPHAKSNARTLDWGGNEVLAGSLTTTEVIENGISLANKYQAKLSTGTNITINQNNEISVVVDSSLSRTSKNPVQNKVIKSYIDTTVGDIDTLLTNLNTGGGV